MDQEPKIQKEGKATDQELVDFLSVHIDNPCETELYDGQIVNIREFYIREAEKVIGSFTDMAAKKKLQDKIDQYKK